MTGPLKTRVEAAAELRIHPDTLKKWVTKERVPCSRVGRLVRFSDEDIERIKAMGHQEPAKPTTVVDRRRTRAT